jgi:hypothetical protein
MKRIVLMTVLALALPLAASAGSVDFSNEGGTLTGSSSGLTLTGSNLIGVVGLGSGICGEGSSSCGSVAFTTGSPISLNLAGLSTFSSGGSFTITGNGSDGLPTGVIFSGAFSSTVDLQYEMTLPNGSKVYNLTGMVFGKLNGQSANGFTSQPFTFTVISGKDGFMGSATLGSGNTIIGTVPEPGTLALLGTGMVGLAGVIRKRLKA